MLRRTIGIIVALPEEFDAVRAMIDNEQRYRAAGPGGGREYLLGDIPSVRNGIHRVVIAQATDMGNTSAGSRASKMVTEFDGLEHIIMCGIAGGVPNPKEPQEHVRLGDIVVSNRKGVIQYDFGKQKGKVFEERFAPRPPSASLLEAVQSLEQDKLAGQRPWEAHLRRGLVARSLVVPDAATDVVLDDKGEPIEHPVVLEVGPRVFLAPIASANVVQADPSKRDRLRDWHKVKAVEMEGSGVADATWEYEKVGYLVVRGICDYCDYRTKPIQTDIWKRYAAMVAAAYVRALIEAMPSMQRQGAGSQPVARSDAREETAEPIPGDTLGNSDIGRAAGRPHECPLLPPRLRPRARPMRVWQAAHWVRKTLPQRHPPCSPLLCAPESLQSTASARRCRATDGLS